MEHEIITFIFLVPNPEPNFTNFSPISVYSTTSLRYYRTSANKNSTAAWK